MIAKVAQRKGRLDLPIVSGKHLRRISNREVLQSANNAEKFIATRKIDSIYLSNGQKLNRLKELSKMYALYEPCRTAYKESLDRYPEVRDRLKNLLVQGEKITPNQWKAEIQSLQAEYDRIGKEMSGIATELAYAEVIYFNWKKLERELQNESRQQSVHRTDDRQQGRNKRRYEEI